MKPLRVRKITSVGHFHVLVVKTQRGRDGSNRYRNRLCYGTVNKVPYGNPEEPIMNAIF